MPAAPVAAAPLTYAPAPGMEPSGVAAPRCRSGLAGSRVPAAAAEPPRCRRRLAGTRPELPVAAGRPRTRPPPAGRVTRTASRRKGPEPGTYDRGMAATAGTPVSLDAVRAALATVERPRDPPPRDGPRHGEVGAGGRRHRAGRHLPDGRRMPDEGPPDDRREGRGRRRPRRGRGLRRPRRDVRGAAHGAAREAARRPGRPRGPLLPAGLADPGLRGRLGQGRGGQVERHGEPRRGDGSRGPVRGGPGRRRVRVLGAADAGRDRVAHPGRRHDPSADRARA